MIVTTPINADATAKQSAETTGATRASKNLGQDDFLTLLIAQLRHQDPMNPMDNADFTAQMAQFSSLEQLMNINKSLDMLTTAANATNSAQAMSLIGKEVKAEGNSVHVKDGLASDVSFELGETASETFINIEDEFGNVVRTIDLSSMSAGPHQVEWDGKGQNGASLPDGLYNYTVIARDVSGRVLEVNTFTRGVVSAVSFENGVGYVHIGNQKYMLSEILEVTLPKTASSNGGGESLANAEDQTA